MGMPPPPPGQMGGYAMAPPNDSQSTLALILGILSILCCSILGPVAFFIGNSSRNRIQASGGTLGGYGLATAGWIMGIIGTVILALEILWVVILVIGSIASSTSGS
jgi:Domain of unknown function (DUF4190)